MISLLVVVAVLTMANGSHGSLDVAAFKSISRGSSVRGAKHSNRVLICASDDCFPVPPEPPTKPPVKAPIKPPVKPPTKAPTFIIKLPPFPLVAEAPTNAPTKPPTKSPTKKPTKAPTKIPTRNPTKAPTKVPTKAPTKADIPAPTKVDIPAPAPTKASGKSKKCGLLGWSIFCPIRRCGVMGRLFGMCK
jgi:PT repeat